MQIIDIDLLSIKEGVIIHQINCCHKMGTGIALKIRQMYPKHYDDYMRTELKLGSLVTTRINSKFGIIGMLSQDKYGRDKRYTDYKAFEECLNRINNLHMLNTNIKYYIPYHIGCNNAGGDWNIISALIDKVTPFIIVCKYI